MTTAQTDRGTDGDGRTPGRPGPHDFLNVDAHLSEEEKEVRAGVRAFVEDRIRPNISDWFERAHFPRELIPEMGTLGLLGMHLKGYGCAGKSAVVYGLACMELEAGDSGLRTFVSVQGSLAMSAIHKFGSEEQKERWLPPMARGEAIGCFGLTEPTAGSDPASMKTFARREGSDWVLNGEKRWIGMGTIADVAVVWARTNEEGNPIRGFLVPTDAPGFTARDITGKLSMRASVQCDLSFEDVRLPAEAMLPGAEGLKGPFACLNQARYGIIWGSMGAARDSFECALEYASEREQFGKPVASFQLTQEKLVNMMLEVEKGMLLALHLGRMKDEGTLRPEQISFGKLNNVREAIKIAREARTILGGNGVTLDYPILRHANNLESVTRDQTEAEDLVQETYLRAVRAFGQLMPDSNLKSWLFVIMRNAWLNKMRHMRSGPQFVELDGEEENRAEWFDRLSSDPHLIYVRKMEREEVSAAIESLPRIYREIIVLRDIEGFSYQQIAGIIGCPAGTVMSRLGRAREKLRRLLTDWGTTTANKVFQANEV